MNLDDAKMNLEKEAHFRWLLAHGARDAWTYFHPRAHGVIVPEHMLSAKVSVLQWGVFLSAPVRQFVVTSEGVSGLLVFRGIWRSCFLPWEAVDRMHGDGTLGDRFWQEPVLADVINLAEYRRRAAGKR